ncbi:phage integrase N-terminal SAM-like domain-containing protein [Mesorhizobium yinganensis]|uniref:phage integrase N-terminal SAM-like domain-containing protein n=1 Tax=Mesorhizobium yinganensis TaxID=3157707 RepID=UPI0032B763C0
MTRSYRNIRLKGDLVYSEAFLLFRLDISNSTLIRFQADDLRPIDDAKPKLFRGAEITRYLKKIAIDSPEPCPLSKFRCLKCKIRVEPEVNTLTVGLTISGRWMVRGHCPFCDRPVKKLFSATVCDKVHACIDSNTKLGSIDECVGATEVDVGKEAARADLTWTPENERCIYAYQSYGGRYDAKTLDAHIAAVRAFEKFHGGKPFSKMKPEDAAAYRGYVLGARHFSRSTIRHQMSFLSRIFGWLGKQEGYQQIGETFAEGFLLPRRFESKEATEPRPFPTMEEVFRMVLAMPHHTLLQRRDRAIVVASFLFGTRSEATASLRVGLVDVPKQTVSQDPTLMRIKNGKSQITAWFPIGGPLAEILSAWIKEMIDLGFVGNDALFPSDQLLTTHKMLLRDSNHMPIEPWSTDAAVRRAFRRGCAAAGLPYFNPHSARHFLRSVRDMFCRTPEERRAWSHNLGHERESTTELNYAKMTDRRASEIFKQMKIGSFETNAERDLLIAYYEHDLIPGTPEFGLAERLSYERKSRKLRR